MALKSGDRVALFGFAARPEVMTPFVSDTRHFHRLQSEAARLDYHAQEPNFTLAMATLASRLQRRSLIVVFSDFTDPTSAELMVESIGRLVAKHVVLFVTLADEELETIATDDPADMQALAMATVADSLLRQRALVTRRLHQLGIDVIEAPHDRVGTQADRRLSRDQAQGSDRVNGVQSAIERAALRSDRFRLEREGDWKRLEAIVTRMEKGRLRRLSDEDVLALPVLYRTVASSLSIARETSLDAATLGYLEGLVQRAWFLVYGPRVSLGAWLRQFLGGGWGAAVRAMGLDVLIALAVMVAGTAVGWLLVAGDTEWYFSLVPGQFADERVPGASREVLHGTIFGNDGNDPMSAFAAYLFSNNAQVSILAFALGFAFGVPSLMLLVHNTATLGAMLWLYHGQGLLVDFAAWLAVHGTTELFAILLAGASGLHIGRTMAFPGERPVLEAAAEAGRRGALVMTGVVLMLVVAAILEAFARQLIDNTPGRFAVGGFMLVFWLAYFFGLRPRFPVLAAR